MFCASFLRGKKHPKKQQHTEKSWHPLGFKKGNNIILLTIKRCLQSAVNFHVLWELLQCDLYIYIYIYIYKLYNETASMVFLYIMRTASMLHSVLWLQVPQHIIARRCPLQHWQCYHPPSDQFWELPLHFFHGFQLVFHNSCHDICEEVSIIFLIYIYINEL